MQMSRRRRRRVQLVSMVLHGRSLRRRSRLGKHGSDTKPQSVAVNW